MSCIGMGEAFMRRRGSGGRVHPGMSMGAARAEAFRMLDFARIRDARGLSAGPCLPIADKPTTALDVTVRAQIPERSRIARLAGIGSPVLTRQALTSPRRSGRVFPEAS
ncbi:hypothetical protein [Aureimonas ureilytica]|uniref:hypothetical protein n=1 Tax=Aureimonas ureilytica TaxID=401562 RepID=UPI0019D4BF76|nr:hypothetical protein [Aureimonas ureilytica]